jgi:cystathionine beta-lyase
MLKVEPDRIVITPGVVPAVNAAVRAYSGEGGSVIIQSPAYPRFGRRRPTTVRVGGKPRLSSEATSTKWTSRPGGEVRSLGAKSMILCNPHNPSGACSARRAPEDGGVALRHGAVMISDEIHCELVLKGYKHIPFASLSPEFAKNSITCYAASKTFNIAGMHCSVAIIPDEELRKRFNEAKGA